MESKKQIYTRIKIAGMLMYIPLVLCTAMISGYLMGEYVSIRFPSFTWAEPLGIGIGAVVSIEEVIRIIRVALAIERKDTH